MTTAFLGLAALRVALLLGGALAVVWTLRRTSASTRRSVLAATFVMVIAMPLASALLPSLRLGGAAAPESALPSAAPVTEPIIDGALASLPAVAGPAAHASFAPPVSDASGLSLVTIVMALWAAGALVVLARLVVGLVRVRRIVREARFVATLDVAGRPIELRTSAAITTPAVTGVLLPVVLLPTESETWSTERRDLVLAHELAHIAHRDHLTSLVAQVAVALHWFDPLAWIAARRLRLERELAADARVLESGIRASTYAEHLLALATARPSARPVPVGALAMAEAPQLSTRIRTLLSMQPHARLGRVRYMLAALGVSVAAFVACASPEREVPPAPAPPPAPTVPTPAATPATPAASGPTTIDPQIQAIVEDELARMSDAWTPCAAIVLVLDPHTGHVVAAAHRGPETSAQLAAVRPMVPGSTMKPLVIAAALEEGVLQPGERIDTHGVVGTLADEQPSDSLDVGEILARSSNVGVARIFERLGGMRLAAWQKKFHIAAAPATIADGPPGAPYAIGAKVASTPLEMAAAFAALANDGVYHAPTFVQRVDDGERIVSAATASAVLGLLEPVTKLDCGTGQAARVPGVRVAGKTGTSHLGAGTDSSDLYASFVGAAPLEAPRYVIFVGAETPKDGGFGGQVAAPVFGRVMTRLLAR